MTEGAARRASGPAVPVRGHAVVVGPPRRTSKRVGRPSLVARRDVPRQEIRPHFANVEPNRRGLLPVFDVLSGPARPDRSRRDGWSPGPAVRPRARPTGHRRWRPPTSAGEAGASGRGSELGSGVRIGVRGQNWGQNDFWPKSVSLHHLRRIGPDLPDFTSFSAAPASCRGPTGPGQPRADRPDRQRRPAGPAGGRLRRGSGPEPPPPHGHRRHQPWAVPDVTRGIGPRGFFAPFFRPRFWGTASRRWPGEVE